MLLRGAPDQVRTPAGLTAERRVNLATADDMLRCLEGLLMAFAAALALMAVAQVLPLMVGTVRAWDGHVYLLRLAAFATMITSILIKNLPPRRPR